MARVWRRALTAGFKDSKIQVLASLSSLRSVQEFKDSRIQGFKDSKIQRFNLLVSVPVFKNLLRSFVFSCFSGPGNSCPDRYRDRGKKIQGFKNSRIARLHLIRLRHLLLKEKDNPGQGSGKSGITGMQNNHCVIASCPAVAGSLHGKVMPDGLGWSRLVSAGLGSARPPPLDHRDRFNIEGP